MPNLSPVLEAPVRDIVPNLVNAVCAASRVQRAERKR